VNAIFAELEASGRQILLDSGVPESEITYARTADFRYVGQGYEVRVPVPSGALSAERKAEMVAAFEAVYRQLYGRSGPAVGVEIVSWRLLVSGPRPELRLSPDGVAAGTLDDARKGERRVYHPEYHDYHPTPVYDRYRLAPGVQFEGPAIVEERESTAVIGPRGRATIDEHRNLRVDLAVPT
jgi:N-methylhydantoinase A